MKNENSFYNYLVKLTVCERECFRFCFCDFRTSSAERVSCFLVKIMHLSTERQSLDTCPGLPASLSSRYLLSSAKVELRRPLTSDPNTMSASPTPQTVTLVRAGVTVCHHRWSVVEDASVSPDESLTVGGAGRTPLTLPVRVSCISKTRFVFIFENHVWKNITWQMNWHLIQLLTCLVRLSAAMVRSLHRACFESFPM